jgi:hypothetical protein
MNNRRYAPTATRDHRSHRTLSEAGYPTDAHMDALSNNGTKHDDPMANIPLPNATSPNTYRRGGRVADPGEATESRYTRRMERMRGEG